MLHLNKLMTRKIPAVFLTVAILFTTVFSMSIFANAASSFSPRLSAPSYDNAYYYSNKNLYHRYGYGMPNCTCYAYGRAYEILGKEPKLCPYSAEEWYGYNKSNGYYSYGQTPKLGAIACWYYNGGGGHVAVVEKIENGVITLSNSAWSGTNFYLTTCSTSDKNYGGSSWWNFQGFIYIGDFSPTPTTKPQSYTTGMYKTNVSDSLNMRSGAGTSYSWVTSVPNNASLKVTQVKSAEGYTWGYTTYNGKTGWVALDYCTYVSPLPTEAPTTAKPTTQPTTAKPTQPPTTVQPTTAKPTQPPTTVPPTTAAPTEPVTTKPQGLGVGDVNADGRIDINDGTLIQKYLAMTDELTDDQVSWCDFDFDGEVTINDVTGLQRFLAGIYGAL